MILFLRELERKKLAKGTKVINAKSLIKYWLNLHKKPKKIREYMVKEPIIFLKKVKLEYALTTYQAENLVQRYLFPTRTDIYIEENDLETWHKLLTKEGLYGRGNFRIIITDQHIRFGKRRVNGLFMVGIPQLIIDLFTEGGPAEEAAEMLIKKVK